MEILQSSQHVDSQSSSTDETYSLEGQHVLLAEDCVDQGRLYLKFFQLAGAEVTLVRSGQSAIDAVMDSPNLFDTVVMDFQMPGMSGLDATRQLRELGYHGAIIAITAFNPEELKQLWFQAGCDEFLKKPLKKHELIGAFKKLRHNRETPRGVLKRMVTPLRLTVSKVHQSGVAILQNRTVLALTVLVGVSLACLLWHQSIQESRLIESAAVDHAARYNYMLSEFRATYTSEVVKAAVAQGLDVKHNYQGIAGAIPLPTTLSMLVSNRLGRDHYGVRVRLYSPYPYPHNNEKGSLQDSFQREAWDALNENPEKPFIRFEEIDGRQSMRYATADLIESCCVQFYNNHPSKNHSSKPKREWKEGDIRGILEVDIALDGIIAQADVDIWKSFIAVVGLFTLGVTCMALIITQSSRNSKELENQIAVRKQAENALQELAFCDALTGLPNRAAILRFIQNEIDCEDGDHFALLFLDMDRFKFINDSLGHEVGDELLKEIAHRLEDTFRTTDNIFSARLGGDEFVVLLNKLSSPADATVVAQRLVQKLSQSYKLGSHTVYSTASIGVVTSEDHYESARDMLRDADLAMYEAKAAGKGCYLIFDKAMRDQAQTRLRIEEDLREAISRNEFTLVYQPIVSLETGELKGAEALIRWIHPQDGLIAPDQFISIAEETGIIVSIGNWVLNEACRQLAEWRCTLGDGAPSCIHVNVSRRQLLLPNLVRCVEQTLQRHALPPECLHLEVTESMIMHDEKTTVATLAELRDLGVKIDMDDFGTGYSSLSCLHKFPIDVLKIDRSFISSVKNIRDFAALLHAVLTLADNLGMQVVSEGIEDAQQLAILQGLGCQYGQGYFFAKPLSVDDFEIYVNSVGNPTPSQSEVLSTDLPVSMLPGETNQISQCEVQR